MFQLFKKFNPHVDDQHIIDPISDALKRHANIQISKNSQGHFHLVQTNLRMPSTMTLNLTTPRTMAQHLEASLHDGH
jgi:uncharacterized circularly permuted ATP-grasp superfamily protein